MDAFEKQKRDGVAINLHRSCELYSPNTGGGGIKRHESRIEIYIPTIDRARRECKVRNEESRFLSSLSLSLSFSTSIAIPPARFLVNQGIFPLPPARMQSHHRCRAASSFLPSPRKRERERAAVFRRWNFIFIRVLRVVRTRNGCDDIANTRRFSGESRGLDETKLEGGERKTERRLPFVSGFPSFGFRSFVRSSPRETRESPFSFSFPNFSQLFLYFVSISSTS